MMKMLGCAALFGASVIAAVAPAGAATVDFKFDSGGLDFQTFSFASVYGTGRFTTAADTGYFKLGDGLTAFSVTGTSQGNSFSGAFNLGLADLASFDVVLAGGVPEKISFALRLYTTKNSVAGYDFGSANNQLSVDGGTLTGRRDSVNLNTKIAYVTAAASGPGSGGPAPVAGVPEPETWALMILGFGLVGAAARRRRTLAAVA